MSLPKDAIENAGREVAAAAQTGLTTHTVSKTRRNIALAIAGAADAIQLGFFPVFSEGALSLPDDVLDLVVTIALFITLGWNWRVLAALVVELIPGVALFPSWTAAVLTIKTTK